MFGVIEMGLRTENSVDQPLTAPEMKPSVT